MQHVDEANRIESLHEKALDYAAFHLGLSDSVEEPAPPTKYCTLFKYCGDGLRDQYNMSQRKAFLDEIRFYMNCCEVEQTYVRPGALPDVNTYWEHRLGTSSVFTYNALAE